MNDRQASPPPNSSRTVAKYAVAVLVVIAIAGIVLAMVQRGPPLVDATHPASAPMTAASAAFLAAEAEARPNEVIFAPDSAQLTSVATAKLQSLAEKAKTDKQSLSIIARVEPTPEGKDERTRLARSRAIAVRGVLEASGIPLSRMETKIEGLASGLAAARGTNRIEVNPR